MAKSKSSGTVGRPSDEEISARAYELYLQRGSVSGHETDDWLQAEAELIEARRNAEAAFGAGQSDQSSVGAGAAPDDAQSRKANGRRDTPSTGRRSLRQ
jgi:hypothetical protein